MYVSVCPDVTYGHAQRKKHVVELYCFVAHAQQNATCTRTTKLRDSEGEELGKEAENAHVAGLNVTENQQDSGKEREDNGRALEPEPRIVSRATPLNRTERGVWRARLSLGKV